MATPSPSSQAITPVLPPPPGVQSNFIDPSIAGGSFPIFVAVGLVFATIFLVIRLYTKAYILKKFGPEDGTMIGYI